MIKAEAPPHVPVQSGTLCPDCGEPMFFIATGFRKPTAEEYAEIATQPVWQMARMAFLEVKSRDHKGVIHANWTGFRDQALGGLVGDSVVLQDERFTKLIETLFYCGAASTLHTIEEDVERCDGRLHLDAIIAIHKAELDALFGSLGLKPATRRHHS